MPRQVRPTDFFNRIGRKRTLPEPPVKRPVGRSAKGWLAAFGVVSEKRPGELHDELAVMLDPGER